MIKKLLTPGLKPMMFKKLMKQIRERAKEEKIVYIKFVRAIEDIKKKKRAHLLSVDSSNDLNEDQTQISPTKVE